MKKVVILSYFFPPCQLTASQRSFGWAKCLKAEGWDPIVITRNWEHHIGGPDDMHHDSGIDLVIDKNEDYEAHYLPFKGNLRDRMFSRHGKNKYNLARKFLSLAELLLHHFTNRVIAYSNLYDYSLEFCKKHKDVDMIIVTGNPFELFRFGALLHKNTGIKWIADYRDDWNTSEVNHSRGFADGLLKKLEIRSEKKWVGTAEAITSVSPYYVKKISEFTGKPGTVILNGYFEEDLKVFRDLKPEEDFTVVYNGMLYPSQEIEVFLDAFKKLVDENPDNRNRIKMRFPGILFLKHVAERVMEYMKGYEDVIELTERISRKEVLEIQAKAHLLLMVSHKGAIGIPSSKIYEYLGLRKPVLICPGDKDILDRTFEPYNLGHIAYSNSQAFDVLNKLFSKYLKGEYSEIKPDEHYTSLFSRQKQAKILAEFMNEISEHSRQ
jgi:glycosyltransferase involved in cell wall biosynthesis